MKIAQDAIAHVSTSHVWAGIPCTSKAGSKFHSPSIHVKNKALTLLIQVSIPMSEWAQWPGAVPDTEFQDRALAEEHLLQYPANLYCQQLVFR